MITAIRRSFQSKSYKIVLWITIAALAGVFSLPQLFKEYSTNAWIAKINSREVPFNDFVLKAQAQEMRIQMLRQQYGQFADMLLQSLGMSADPKIFALESVIRDELVNQAAQKLNIRISEGYLTEKLSSPQFVQQELSDLVPMFVLDPYNGINTVALRAYLQRMRLSMSDFEHRVDNVLERHVFMDALSGAVYIPDAVLKERYINEYSAKKYSILRFSFGDYLAKAKNQSASPEQLKAFYDRQNKEAKRYWVPEQRAGIVLTFDPASYGLTIDEDKIEAYYNDHKKEFLEAPIQLQVRRILFKSNKATAQEVYEKAQKVREELIANPDSFAQKAKELSEDAESGKQGGLMPFFALGSKNKVFDRAAFLLQKDGDISDVIATEDGVEIIQRVAKKQATYKPVEAVKKDIEQKLIQKKFKEQFAHDVQGLLNAENPDTAIVTPLIKRATGKETIALAENDSSARMMALFKIKKAGNYGFYVADGKGYLVQATTINLRNLPTLDAIKDAVEGDWQEERASELLAKDLQQAKEQVKAKSMAELRDMFKAKAESTGLVKKSDEESLKQLQQKGLPVAKMLELSAIGSAVDAKADMDGYLARLDEVEPFNEAEFVQKRKELLVQAQAEQASILAQTLVASLSRNATITINESMLKSGK